MYKKLFLILFSKLIFSTEIEIEHTTIDNPIFLMENSTNNSDKIEETSFSYCDKIRKAKNLFFRKLSTPTGITTIAVVYSAAQGVTNFIWAFNWTRLGIDLETALKISEGGGISTAGLCWLFGVSLPVIVYIWQKRHPDEEEKIN